MELEEMQKAWEKLSEKVERQDLLTTHLVEKSARQSYHSRLNRIRHPEFMGTMVCYVAAGYVSVHFIKIEDLLMQVQAILTIGLLLVLPILSLASVRGIRGVNISVATYVETIQTFARQKMRFQKLQKINVVLGLLLLFVSLPVLAAIQGKTLHQIPYFWSVLLPVGVLVFAVFAYWVLGVYTRTLTEMESLLTDIRD